jgi:small subunit ribosomal protein S17
MDGKYSGIMKAKDIGYDVKPPKKTCEDPDCPFHGKLPIRGKITEGKVESAKMGKSVVIERNYLRFVPKYERYERRRKRITVHKPDCIDLEKGDLVKIAECRPLSKTKHFVVIEKMEAKK